MATANSLKNQIQERSTNQVSVQQLGIKSLMNTPTMKKKFEDILHDNANAFMANVLTLVNNDSYLAKSEPMSIVTGALMSATLNLGLDKNLGYAYLVPFKAYNNQTGQYEQKAQFILGYKGYIQLAQRSGQYKALNVIEVYEGELKSWNRLTEEFEFDPEGKISDNVIGYVGYFELLNGFKKTVYWTKQQIETHRIKNNKDKNKTALSGAWKENYDSMAKKTVLRNMLSKWGILSIDMQKATTNDEHVIKDVTEDGEIVSDLNLAEIKPAETVEEESEENGEAVQEELLNMANQPVE